MSAKIFCATFIFLFFLQKNQAQTSTENFPPPHTPPGVKAAKTTAKTAPDGLLDEVNWQAAPLIADFFRMKPKQGGNYDFLTTVRLLFNDETKDNDWDALWFVKTKILENGWSVEFAIPFKSLRYELPKEGEAVSWGFTASRLAHRTY